MRERYISGVSIATFILTAMFLIPVQIKLTDNPVLILERLFSGGGWLQIFILSVYAGIISTKLIDPFQSSKWRVRVWRLFSIVFFAQLILGLSGLDIFLMTGELHFPIPALIAGGPVYRGEGFFMPILLVSTLIIAGPVWCSYLCYMGSWDDIASRKKSRPGKLPKYWIYGRFATLIILISAALLLRYFEASTTLVIILSVSFGLIGVLIMLLFSTRNGNMLHCTMYCPIGLIVNVLGKLNPMRIRIKQDCDKCMLCVRTCRYGALDKLHIERHKPGFSCTLCGDCIHSCKKSQIEYKLPFLSPTLSHKVFIVITTMVHAVFLSIAKI